MPDSLKDSLISKWERLWRIQGGKEDWLKRLRESTSRRISAQTEILDLLTLFSSDRISLEEFGSIFDTKTRREWSSFGIKGYSGGMFLNKLVKHLPNKVELGTLLCETLELPSDDDLGQERMLQFLDYLNHQINLNVATRQQLQPNRSPFFMSIWWHLQGIEEWPIFYISGRRVLSDEGIYQSHPDPVLDYFSFREAFESLRSALDLSSWELEYLLNWYDSNPQNGPEPIEPPIIVLPDEGEEPTNEVAEGTHTHIQWLLATIGIGLGCRIWIASNDHNKEWEGQRLGDISLENLPNLGIGEIAQKIVRYIDVVWLSQSNQIFAAFEVEHTTSIYSGLLRMSDLASVVPNLVFNLYIVVPESRVSKVETELSRPTFQDIELHRRCRYISYEDLQKEADTIKKWANDPKQIDQLARRVPDTDTS